MDSIEFADFIIKSDLDMDLKIRGLKIYADNLWLKDNKLEYLAMAGVISNLKKEHKV